MGRMADARRRARRSESPDENKPEARRDESRAPEGPADETAAPAPEMPEMTFPAEEMTFPAEDDAPAAEPPRATSWVAKDETFAAPPKPQAAPPEPPRSEEPRGEKKLVLPASGLASDILALAESMDVDMAPPSTAVVPAVVPEAPEPAARAHNISFFAAPVRDERKAVEAAEHLATFFLAGEE